VSGALPTFVIIGAMKCGTSALHRMLGAHPDIAMSDPKELNFFFGTAPPVDADDPWSTGNWWRGAGWYAAHFPTHAPVRGEASPGYTSPDHPHVAARLAATLPDARLVYLVRDPVDRAISQYLHHRRDGTEDRPLAEALLDPASQYLARSRYHERLTPFLDRFPNDRILIVATEDLRDQPAPTMARVLRFLDADPQVMPSAHIHGPSATATEPEPAVRHRVTALLRADADRLRRLAKRRFAQWSV
jgi:hypothetical protein